MKWHKKYDLNLAEIYSKHLEGFSLPELSVMYGVPRTTLNRYLLDAGYQVYFNRYHRCLVDWKRRQIREEFVCVNAWKRALLERQKHECLICQYSKIVEAHHIMPQSLGGKSTRNNGILLCPNHHAEAHAGLLDQDSLFKLATVVAMVEPSCDIKRICSFKPKIQNKEEVK